MPVNSMNSDFPPQPDNPCDEERHFLARYALARLNRLEDFAYVKGLMSPPEDVTAIACPGEFKGYKIGVIGGGLAGMAAAFELRKLGFDITVFDALEDRIGGRVYTYYFDTAKTLYGEFGPMRIPVNHETTWHYINLFGLDTRTFIQANDNGMIYLRGARSRGYAQSVKRSVYPKFKLTEWERNTPWRQMVTYGYDSPLFRARPDQRTEILQVKRDYNPYTLYWDLMNGRQMLQKAGLSEDAISLISYLSPISGNYLYNSYIDSVQEYYPPDLSFVYEITGGEVKLPLAFFNSFIDNRLASRLYRIPEKYLGNVVWKGANWVTGIYKSGNGSNVSLSYSNKNAAHPLREEFDYVVCAIPFSSLRNLEVQPLFSPGKMQAIKEVTYGNAQKSLLLCNSRFWEEQGIIGGPSYTDLPVTTLWYPSDHARYFPGLDENTPDSYTAPNSTIFSKGPGVLTVYNFNLDAIRMGNLPEALRFQELKRDVEMVHGLGRGYLDNIAVSMKTVNWDSEKWFRGAFCYITPEQKRLFSYVMSVPEYGNRIFFAGEHISAKHRWMQGALQSGMYAANELALACKRDKRA